MTNIYYDTEFIDNGITIELISIGMVREDGSEYYAVRNNLSIMTKAARDPWLKENVLSSLPICQPVDPAFVQWDITHPDFDNIKDKDTIALEVHRFITSVPDPDLWAYFSAYDHVVLAQLYGPMVRLPRGIPMRSSDLAQEAKRLGKRAQSLPHMPGTNQHNALDDAREVKYRYNWLRTEELAREYDRTESIPVRG